MISHWEGLFSPSHVLVVGASERPYSLGEEVMTALTGAPFKGKITPINPKHKRIGVSDAYRSIAGVPEAADLAILLTPSEDYEASVRGCIRKKITHVIVLLPYTEPSEEDLSHLQKSVELARRHGIHITVCTPSGLLVPSIGLAVSRYCFPVSSGSIGILGYQGEFVADTLYRLQDLPFGIGKAINLLPVVGATQPEEVVDRWASDTALKTLVVQYAPKVGSPQKLLSALRHAARHQTVILHCVHTLDDDECIMIQAAAEECGVITTFTPEALRFALYAAHWFKGSEKGKVYLVGNAQSGWLSDVARQFGISVGRLPENVLPEQCSMQTIRKAVDAAWQQDDCEAVLLLQPAPMVGQMWDCRVLAETCAAQKRLLFYVAPDAQGRYGFRQPETIFRILAARQRSAALKQQLLTVMPPRKTLPTAPMKSLTGQLSAGRLVQKLSLPPLVDSEAQVVLRYTIHAALGAYVTLMLPENPQIWLPPFHSGHAHLLKQHFPLIKQEDWEQLLTALNRAAYHVPQIVQADFATNDTGETLQTVRLNVNPTAKAVMPLWAEPQFQVAHTFGKKGGPSFAVRTLEAADAEALQTFVRALSPQARKTRFMMAGKELSPQLLSRFTRLDYRREAAFLAEIDGSVVAHAQYSCRSFPESCEFGISVLEDYRGNGLAFHLMKQLIESAERQGYLNMYATILADNQPMLKLAEKLGFKLRASQEEKNLIEANLILRESATAQALRIAKQILAQKG